MVFGLRPFFLLATLVFLTLWATSSFAAVVTLVPTADAYTQAGTNATANFGSTVDLRVQTSATTASNYDSYLKFDTTSVAGVISNVKLRIYAKLSATGTVTTTAYGVPTTTWGETTINWNNKPAPGAALGSVIVNSTTYAYKEIDVTAYVKGEYDANRKVVSFVYRNTANTTPYITGYSRNSTSANKPQLVVTYATNAAPTVSISSPTVGASFVAPANINLTASAADTDGTIAKVEYYNGAILIATGATTAPYTATWSNVAAGTYSLTAKATDNAGAVTTSAVVSVTVNAAVNAPPTAALTSPIAGATFTAPVNISLTANAADSDGTITKIEYYSGGVLIATGAATPPYSAVWSNVAAGSYSLTVRATDNKSAVTTSAPVAITVAAPNVPPSINLTAPTSGTSLVAPAAVNLSANATDTDGSITKVEYFNGPTLIATGAATAPYAAAWSNVAAGSYSLTAKATDNNSAVTTSAPIAITVAAPNSPPTVSLTAPNNAATFVAPAAITLSANATDTDGTVTKVEYYSGTTLIGMSTGPAPYAVTWSNVGAGSYSLTAKAIDNTNAVTTSAAVTINTSAPRAPIDYAYDELGRLTGVSDGAGGAAQYVYDAVGNIVSIKRLSGSATAIIDFTPDAGVSGTEVTITGSGFGTTPALNTVTFNGLSAAISSATANRLVVNAPTGVTSGPISVTSVAGSATSATNFLVGAGLSAPTITSFNPVIGSAGTVVNITGTNFDTGVGRTKVRFNQITLAVTSGVTATSLTAIVPANTGSGKIRIVTPGGFVDSAEDFTIPPASIPALDIVDTKRIAVGGVQTLNITPASKVGLLLIEGGANPYRTLNVTALTTTPAASAVPYEIYSPQGILMASGSINDTVPVIHLPALTQSATYAVYFKPGVATASITAALSINKSVVVDGGTVAESITANYQTARFTFNGTVGQNIALGLTGLALNPSTSSYATISVYRPDGALFTSAYCYTSNTAAGGCGINLNNLTVTGTYTVVVTPVQGGTGSFNATLSSDLLGTVVTGTAFNLGLTRQGQNGRLSFNGTAGDNLGLSLSAVVTAPTTASGGTVYVYRPDGSQLTAIGFSNSNSQVLDLPALPVTGTYTVFIDMPNAATGGMTLLLTQDLQTPLVLDGAASNVTLALAGQTARLTFDGTVGQNLGLGVTGLTLTPSTASYASILVYRPDGVVLTSATCYTSTTPNGGCGLNLNNLPIAGVYTVLIAPYLGATGSFAATLSSEVVGVMTPGTPFNLSLSRAGQNGRLSFSGTAGDNLGLSLSAITIAPTTAGNATLTVTKPDGSVFANISFSNGGARVLDLPVLVDTGTYTLTVDLPNAATGALSLLLAPVLQAPLVLDAAPTPITLLTGQNGRFSFTLNATQSLGLGVSAISTAPTDGQVDIQVQQPNGFFISCGAVTTSGSCNLPGLVAGTYTVFVEPGVNAASLTLTLSSDLSGTLTANGPAQIFSTNRVGQNGAYVLTAIAGQPLALSWPSSTIATGSLSVIAPDNTIRFSGVSLASANALEWTAVAGTYQVRIDPTGASTGNIALQLATDLTGALAIDGVTTSVSLLPGQNGRFTFAGSTGQNLGLGISAYAATPAGATANLAILDPTGVVLTSTTISGSGASLNATALPASGTYTVVVDPVGVPAASFNVTLSQDSIGTLTANGPTATFSSARIGQNGAYTFAGSAEQGAALLLSNSTLGISNLTVSGPTGIIGATSLTQPGSFVLDLGALPGTGSYTVFVDPAGIQTGAVTMGLVSDLTGTLVINTSTATAITTATGQNARYTFTGNAGTRYAVAATGIATVPAGVGVSISVLDPAGNAVTSCGGVSVDTICDVPSLNSSGSYTVFIDSPGTATASLAFSIKSEVTATATIDSAVATATSFTAGQNVRVTFNNTTVGATPKLAVSSLTLAPTGSQAYLRVLDPNGNNIFGSTYWIFTTGGYTIDLPALDSVGDYVIEFDPQGFSTGTASFAVRNSTAASISIDGPAVTVSLAANQQPAFNFTTSVPNQGITLSFSGMSTTPIGGALRYSMSNATSWTSNIVAPGVNIPQLPLVNVRDYSMTLLPQSAFTGAITVALVNDQTGTLTIGGAAVTHTPTRAAQSKRITFTNTTANRATTIRINSSQWTSGTWWLIPPPGGGVTTSTFPASTVARNVPVTLVQTGTYTLILVPAGTNVGTVSASVL